MILVTLPAPNFTAPAVLKDGKIIDNFDLKTEISGKSLILFFWPMDFTFVCPSEIISFNNSYSEFKKRNVEVIGVSIDSVFVHTKWRNTPINKGGIGKINFTIISDIKREIQNLYGIEHPSLGIALRATFFIDDQWIVRHQTINDLPIGRNIKETLRIIDSFQFHKKFGEVCPANWEKGKDGIIPTYDGITKYLTKNKENL